MHRLNSSTRSNAESETKSIEFKAIENEKGRFIEYIVASTGTDRAEGLTDDGFIWRGDNLTVDCIKSMADQLKHSIGVINDPSDIKDMDELLSNVNTGIGHEHVVVSKDIVPVSQTVDVEVIEKNGQTMIKATDRINEYAQRADAFWNMIKSGVMRFASIEFKPTKYHFKEVGGKIQRFVEDAYLKGKAWTGTPAQPLCGVINLSVKSVLIDDERYSELKTQMENKMADEEAKKEEVKEEAPAPATEEVKEPVVEEASEDVKSLKETNALLQKELEELKSQVKSIQDAKDDSVIEESKEFIEKKFEELKAHDKSLVEKEQEKFEETKSYVTAYEEDIKAAKTVEQKWEIGLKALKDFERDGGDVVSLFM